MKTLAKLIAILTLTLMAAVWLVGPANAHAFSMTLDHAPGAAGLFGVKAPRSEVVETPAQADKAQKIERERRAEVEKTRDRSPTALR